MDDARLSEIEAKYNRYPLRWYGRAEIMELLGAYREGRAAIQELRELLAVKEKQILFLLREGDRLATELSNAHKSLVNHLEH